MHSPFVLPLVKNVEDSKTAPLNHVRAYVGPAHQLRVLVNVALTRTAALKAAAVCHILALVGILHISSIYPGKSRFILHTAGYTLDLSMYDVAWSGPIPTFDLSSIPSAVFFALRAIFSDLLLFICFGQVDEPLPGVRRLQGVDLQHGAALFLSWPAGNIIDYFDWFLTFPMCPESGWSASLFFQDCGDLLSVSPSWCVYRAARKVCSEQILVDCLAVDAVLAFEIVHNVSIGKEVPRSCLARMQRTLDLA